MRSCRWRSEDRRDSRQRQRCVHSRSAVLAVAMPAAGLGVLVHECRQLSQSPDANLCELQARWRVSICMAVQPFCQSVHLHAHAAIVCYDIGDLWTVVGLLR